MKQHISLIARIYARRLRLRAGINRAERLEKKIREFDAEHREHESLGERTVRPTLITFGLHEIETTNPTIENAKGLAYKSAMKECLKHGDDIT
jgi:hypothetical protein